MKQLEILLKKKKALGKKKSAPYRRIHVDPKWGLTYYIGTFQKSGVPIRFVGDKSIHCCFDFERNRFMVGNGTRAKNDRFLNKIGWRKRFFTISIDSDMPF